MALVCEHSSVWLTRTADFPEHLAGNGFSMLCPALVFCGEHLNPCARTVALPNALFNWIKTVV